MSSVIPKDLTGMVRHPTKMDCWIPGERPDHANLCMETPISETVDCTLRKAALAERLAEHPYEMPAPKATMDVFNEISLDWKTQIYNNVVKRFGGPESTYLQGIVKDTNLPEQAVVEFADVVIKEYDNDPKLAADILKACITEHITMMSSMMVNNALKEKGLMGQITKVTDNMIEQVNAKTAGNEELIKLIEGAEGVAQPSVPSPDQFHNPKRVKFDSEGNVVRKKKGKRKSQHIPNMKTASVKRVLGASILHMLGTVQRDTQDAHKRALLKEIPAADLIEMASGEKIPDYQANLINSWQAKADPEAPIVKRMTDETKAALLTELQEECVAVQEQVTDLEKKSFETLLEESIKYYINPELFPYGADEQLVNQAIEKTRQFFLSRQDEVTAQAVGFQLMDDLDSVGVVPPYGQTAVRLVRHEDGSKTYRFTIDPDDPQPDSTISFVLKEIGVANPVEIIKGDFNVTAFGGNIKDLKLGYKDLSKIYHYERFTEEAADELSSTIAYVQEHIADQQFYEGLVGALITSSEPKVEDWLTQFGEEHMWYLVNKHIVGYTVGYVQGINYSKHKLASQETEVAQAADLG